MGRPGSVKISAPMSTTRLDAASVAVEKAIQTGNPTNLGVAHFSQAICLMSRDAAAAAAACERALSFGDQVRNQWLIGITAAVAAGTIGAGGKPEEALPAILAAADELHRTGWTNHAWSAAWGAVRPCASSDMTSRLRSSPVDAHTPASPISANVLPPRSQRSRGTTVSLGSSNSIASGHNTHFRSCSASPRARIRSGQMIELDAYPTTYSSSAEAALHPSIATDLDVDVNRWFKVLGSIGVASPVP